jgi:hypothetical protein
VPWTSFASKARVNRSTSSRSAAEPGAGGCSRAPQVPVVRDDRRGPRGGKSATRPVRVLDPLRTAGYEPCQTGRFCQAGRDRGSPNRESTLLSKRVIAQI